MRTFFVLLLAITLRLLLLAPILAMDWSERPFPGFLVEQTLVVTDANKPPAQRAAEPELHTLESNTHRLGDCYYSQRIGGNPKI